MTPADEVELEMTEFLALAEELTREEQLFEYYAGQISTCGLCQAQTSTDGEHLDHLPTCKWLRFRDLLKSMGAA